jgi:hypothetical protein
MTNAFRNPNEQNWQKNPPNTQSHALRPSSGTFACSGPPSLIVDVSFNSALRSESVSMFAVNFVFFVPGLIGVD